MMKLDDVPLHWVHSTLKRWRELMSIENAGNPDELADWPLWHLFEAMQFLLTAACEQVGLPAPVFVSFSCSNSIEDSCECEVLLVWSGAYDCPVNEFTTDCTMLRLCEFDWPGLDTLTNKSKSRRSRYIARVLWRLAVVRHKAPWACEKIST